MIFARALISLLYLGGSFSSQIRIYAPGFHHHTCWLATIIYILAFYDRPIASEIFHFEDQTISSTAQPVKI